MVGWRNREKGKTMTDHAIFHMYEIDDGESHWILAATPEAATECFYETFCADDAERADFELSEPKEINQDAVTICDDESAGKRITLRQAVIQHLAGKCPDVPCVIASSVW